MPHLTHLRTDLAAALRWAARLGLHEGICNHFSVAVDEGGGRFLVNPLGLHWSEVKASDLVLADADGTVLDGRHEVEATSSEERRVGKELVRTSRSRWSPEHTKKN